MNYLMPCCFQLFMLSMHGICTTLALVLHYYVDRLSFSWTIEPISFPFGCSTTHIAKMFNFAIYSARAQQDLGMSYFLILKSYFPHSTSHRLLQNFPTYISNIYQTGRTPTLDSNESFSSHWLHTHSGSRFPIAAMLGENAWKWLEIYCVMLSTAFSGNLSAGWIISW